MENFNSKLEIHDGDKSKVFDSQFQCQICKGPSYKNEGNLKRHIKSTHDKSDEVFKCDRCDKTLKSKSGLNNHNESAHSNQKFDCDTCDKTFGKKQLLEYHFKNEHFNPQEYRCDICDKAYCTIRALKEHITLAHSNERIECDACNKTFSSGLQLKIHVKKCTQ